MSIYSWQFSMQEFNDFLKTFVWKITYYGNRSDLKQIYSILSKSANK